MIVQSLDGKWYIDPVFKDNDTLVSVHEDEPIQFFRRGPPVSWRTAVKSLTKLGLRAKAIDGPEDSVTILGEGIDQGLVQACLYMIVFTGPIPTPQHFSGVLSEEPNLVETSEHRLLKWPRSRKL